MVSRIWIVASLLFVGLQAQAQDAGRPAEAAPVIAEGVVPDQATKGQILEKLRGLYGDARVVDRIRVESIPTPPNWGTYVGNMLTPGLTRVSGGKLEVNGQAVRISGDVVNEAQRQQVLSELSMASNTSYTVTSGLQTGGSAQNVLDETLGERIIEFRSGSATLTPLGASILDEMARKLEELGDVRVEVIGHTDNIGNREGNLALSHGRAEAVRAYLARRGIDAQRISVLGKGPDEPISDNETEEGRARNRRIQFRLL
ncbi:OmpA family protein [Luteimonas terrae]|uniref:OOP family OmpA-OmpF porin n=1 Tax=Luteimonas terrae TaxID=1530191 RepID=A0ABU1XX13_9GAMM|nr:OmpA family protein [Luteimonas terrae]MDR7192626.1 OOP family OmpA-OmpF porin [Luteimonas terrae]